MIVVLIVLIVLLEFAGCLDEQATLQRTTGLWCENRRRDRMRRNLVLILWGRRWASRRRWRRLR